MEKEMTGVKDERVRVEKGEEVEIQKKKISKHIHKSKK